MAKRIFFYANNETDLLRKMIKSAGYTFDDLIKVLHIRPQDLQRKIEHNSFSMHEFFIIAYLCEYPIMVGQGNVDQFIDNFIDENTFKRIEDLKAAKRESKQKWFSIIGHLYGEA